MDADRFERAVREHQRMVFNLALHALRDRGLAEETSQDVFLALLQKGERIESEAHLAHWLRQVAARRCIDLIRRRRVRRWLALEECEEASGVAARGSPGDPMLRARLERATRALPATTQLILVLRFQEDLGPAEIGRVLGQSEGAVRQKLRHALTALKQRLDMPRAGAGEEKAVSSGSAG